MHSFQPQEFHWPSPLFVRLLATCVATMVVAAGCMVTWFETNVVVTAIVVPVAVLVWGWAIYRVWRACVALTSTSGTAGTVLVQGWLVDRRVPVDQILKVGPGSRQVPEIRMIDGRSISCLPMSGWPTRKYAAFQRGMMETLSHAARAAQVAHPDQTAAAVLANASLRNWRLRRQCLALCVVGLGLLVYGLATPGGWDVIPAAICGGFFLLIGVVALYLELHPPKLVGGTRR